MGWKSLQCWHPHGTEPERMQNGQKKGSISSPSAEVTKGNNLETCSKAQMSIFCSLRMTGGGKCKAGRKMVRETWRWRGAHELLLLSPYFFSEATVPGEAFREIRLSLDRLTSAKRSRKPPSAHREELKHPHSIKIGLRATSGNCFKIAWTSTSQLNQETSSSLHVRKGENRTRKHIWHSRNARGKIQFFRLKWRTGGKELRS